MLMWSRKLATCGLCLKTCRLDFSMYTQVLGAGRDCGDTAPLELPDDLKKVWVNVWCLDPWIFPIKLYTNFQQTWGWTASFRVPLCPPRFSLLFLLWGNLHLTQLLKLWCFPSWSCCSLCRIWWWCLSNCNIGGGSSNIKGIILIISFSFPRCILGQRNASFTVFSNLCEELLNPFVLKGRDI